MQHKPIFTLQWRNVCFAPSWLPTLTVLILLPILISLGFWQIQRAEYKKSLLIRYQQQFQQTPLTFATIKTAPSLQQLQYYPVNLQGKFDNQHIFLLDNKFYQHQLGYQVLTPFIPNGENTTILINRGWIPRTAAQDLAKISNDSQSINGLFFIPTQQTLVLKNLPITNAWPRVIEKIDTQKISDWLQKPVAPWIILLAPNTANGFVREWNPVVITPYKNIGYAIQWFAMALTLLIIFIVVNTKRVNNIPLKTN